SSSQPNADQLVDVYVRGGYPVDHDVMFSFASNISEHFKKRKPDDCWERGAIYNRVNDVLDIYEDVECTTSGNPADSTGYTWFIATTPVKRVQVRRCDLDNHRKNPWSPPSAFAIPERKTDIEFKQYLAQNGALSRLSHHDR
ncbi:hypothetical protein EV715DRAFT_208226, partial [Schizophyllum commune]